jgi:hypothetical protein
MKYGDPGRKQQRLCLVRSRHAGPDIFFEVIEPVPEFFETGIDPARPGIEVGDRCPAGDIEGDV